MFTRVSQSGLALLPPLGRFSLFARTSLAVTLPAKVLIRIVTVYVDGYAG